MDYGVSDEQGGDLRVASLETCDGYVLESSDLIGEVLADGEALNAIGYADWLEKELPLCTETWLKTSKLDFHAKDDKPKFVAVGLTSRNRLFVAWVDGYQLRSYSKVLRLELFDAASLSRGSTLVKRFGKDLCLGTERGTSVKGKEWELSASLGLGADGTVASVRVSVRPSHATVATVNELAIHVEDGRISHGSPGRHEDATVKDSIRVIVDPDRVPPSAPVPDLPKPSSSGPCFKDMPEQYPHLDNKEEPRQLVPEGKNVAQGDLGDKFVIAQEHKVHVELIQTARNGNIQNFVVTNIRVQNKCKTDMLAIDNVAVEYQTTDGKWLGHESEADGNNLIPQVALVGTRGGHHYYSWQSERSFTVRPLSTEQMAVGLVFHIPLSADTHFVEQHRRLHRSLPSPLNVRISFMDAEGHKSVLTSVAVNPPLVLTTNKKEISRSCVKYSFFQRVDDADAESCVWVGVASEFPSNHGLDLEKVSADAPVDYLQLYSNDMNCCLRAGELLKLAWLAAQANANEIAIASFKGRDAKEQEGTRSCVAFALVTSPTDAVPAYAYALKFVLTTNTGTATHYFKLPPYAPSE